MTEHPTQNDRSEIDLKMQDLERRIFAEPAEVRREGCGGMKRNWERLRYDLARVGVTVSGMDWLDGTTSADYAAAIGIG
jgi:hypothetical protein